MPVKLPSVIFSRDQLLQVADELHTYAAALAKVRQKTGIQLPELSQAASELIKGLPQIKQNSDGAIEELRAELEQLADTLPAVNLTLAGLPSPKLKEELTGWLRALAPDVLVNFHINPDMAGGVIIRTPNRIYDESFRTKILESPEKFTKVLTDVR